MVVSGVTAAAAKLIGVGGSSTAAWLVWRGMPDQKFRRDLNGLFRTGDLYRKIIGYKGRVLRSYPSVKRVNIYLDRKEAAFVLPVGLDPAVIVEHAWLFRQVFGQYAEITTAEDARTFVMRVYNGPLTTFDYDAEAVAECVLGMDLPIYVGKSRAGDVTYDMIRNPHLLISGETGGGKSAGLRSVLTTLIRSCGDRLELYCADMKDSEFHVFKGIAREVVTEERDLERTLMFLGREMKRRGSLLAAAEVAHINDLPTDKRPPYIVLAIDEVALIKGVKRIMDGIERISTIGRALGVFLILSMQRPDADVLDGKLKNNLTVRISFRQADAINSRIAIGSDEASAISNDEKGRLVLKFNGLTYVQGPHLTLEAARELLKPYKRAEESKSAPEPAEDPADIIELGVLE
ncbi:FtsK/SpoIIIE domain-containing protein [Paenibacillus chibensis]|uniref:FtsK/SpoIIIE domain-containing protein n=1 Tax=Paenibacillus chibensis TaxID=59846 RepID=UPI000FDCDCFC|nr:FtsK/SpoIIIE domain-containing protein [Paenibacillus chibensis]MEC0370066.1 FtsK/SpoIIIE domain-containing protein [Paenibacillus chibensis]